VPSVANGRNTGRRRGHSRELVTRWAVHQERTAIESAPCVDPIRYRYNSVKVPTFVVLNVNHIPRFSLVRTHLDVVPANPQDSVCKC
jgi:hypothetical protein